MNITLGAKKDTYTGSRCMAAGILLGRMAYGLDAFGRALEDKTHWSMGPDYSVRKATKPAYQAAERLQKIIPKAKYSSEKFLLTLKDYKPHIQFSYGDRESATKTLAAAREDLSALAQNVVSICGKRRPEPGEGEALLRLKRVKRPKAAPRENKPQVEEPAVPDWLAAEFEKARAKPPEVVPVVTAEDQGSTLGFAQIEEGVPWGIIAGVVGLIGAAFLVGRV